LNCIVVQIKGPIKVVHRTLVKRTSFSAGLGPVSWLTRAGRGESITADTALRLAKRFGNSARFWMGLQAEFDLDEARKSLASS
jgi:hypothetical protein